MEVARRAFHHADSCPAVSSMCRDRTQDSRTTIHLVKVCRTNFHQVKVRISLQPTNFHQVESCSCVRKLTDSFPSGGLSFWKQLETAFHQAKAMTFTWWKAVKQVQVKLPDSFPHGYPLCDSHPIPPNILTVPYAFTMRKAVREVKNSLPD